MSRSGFTAGDIGAISSPVRACFPGLAWSAGWQLVQLLGELVEFGETEQLFTSPVTTRARDYITGRFG